MEHDRPRWRIRLSTLMLLVIIAALSLTLVYERAMRERERRRTEAALREAMQQAQAQFLRGQASVGSTPSPASQGAPDSGREFEAHAP